ncbi:unnamed protein product [Pleuronectes platessa]|uniref:Uncharacterized protein n=1 Tax=Pleuronectes platessa TaxID=8262 RepID=A0A9N7VZ84_PLEPL|nr:unnamed protein product [Pleuronectes platessa]
MLLWPHVKAYVEEKVNYPKVNACEDRKDRCADPLFTVKVAIFNSVAREVTPFLTAFQTDKPMLPFLSEDMFELIWGSSRPVALLSTPPETRRAARLNVLMGGEVLFRGASRLQWCGGFLSLGPRGGVPRRCGRRAVGGDRVRRSAAAATLDACRDLLADHLSYSARWGNPPFARGAPSGGAPRLASSS